MAFGIICCRWPCEGPVRPETNALHPQPLALLLYTHSHLHFAAHQHSLAHALLTRCCSSIAIALQRDCDVRVAHCVIKGCSQVCVCARSCVCTYLRACLCLSCLASPPYLHMHHPMHMHHQRHVHHQRRLAVRDSVYGGRKGVARVNRPALIL